MKNQTATKEIKQLHILAAKIFKAISNINSCHMRHFPI